MVFSSVIFLHYFLPVAVTTGLIAHLRFGTRISNAVLLIASLVFYSWGLGSTFLWLLLLSIGGNYILAILAEDLRSFARFRTVVTLIALLFNIGFLAYFKYANFFVDQASALRTFFGLPALVWEAVVLPIGISFFTFHQLSYIFDIQSGRSNALRNPVDLALYVCFFPQLIAGPIVRFHAIEGQLQARSLTVDDMAHGSVRFVHGLAKKVMIADPAGAVANLCFGTASGEMTTVTAWLGAIAFTVQIYYDFSGYSDMAIGLARIFGFKFPENFARPYAALSITDFWRRWHMTLSSWFRDYVYIPLGGSKTSPERTLVNLMVVFLLTGFWHGANWTFIVWGMYHGTLLMTERLTRLRSVDDLVDSRMPLGEILVRRSAVMLLVMIGWVIFRAADLQSGLTFLHHMFIVDFGGLPPSIAHQLAPDDLLMVVLGVVLSAFPASMVGKDLYTTASARVRRSSTLGLLIIALPFTLMKIGSGSFSPFLYFQF